MIRNNDFYNIGYVDPPDPPDDDFSVEVGQESIDYIVSKLLGVYISSDRDIEELVNIVRKELEYILYDE